MTPGEVLSGLGLLALVVGPIVFGARRLRRRLVPAWGGAAAVLADVVLVLSQLTLVSQVLGTVGLFRAPVLIPVVAISGLLVGLVAGAGSPTRTSPRLTLPGLDSRAGAIAVVALGLVAARWALPTAHAYEAGVVEDDSIAYHLPFAARFVQEGSLFDLHFAVPEIPIAFYPANAELFHSVGMLAFGDDLLSPGLNVGWLALLLLAGWCIGRKVGASPAVIAALALIAGSPLIVTSQAGGAHNDMAGAALFLAAAALLVIGWNERRAVIIAGLAAGLAIGVKYTLLLPVAALTVGVALLAWREKRDRLVLPWLAATSATGGYWYVRNLVHAGSPLPPVRLGVGPIGFPHTEHAVDEATLSIADYADQPGVVWDLMSTALSEAFGALWPLVLAAVVLGMALAVWRPRDPVHRMLGLVAGVAAVGYVLTPATAFGLPGNPIQVYATANLRYALPAIVLSLALLPLSPAFSGRGKPAALTAGFTILVFSMQPARSSIWMAWERGVSEVPGMIAAIAVLAGAGALFMLRGRQPTRTARIAAAGAAVLAVGVGSVIVGDWYADHRYRDDSSGFGRAYTWAQDLEGKRIGVVGSFRHYPLYGPEQANHVQYVGRIDEGERFREIETCSEWRRAIDAGDYDYIVAMPNRENEPPPQQTAWTRSASQATEILRHDPISVFSISGPLSDAC